MFAQKGDVDSARDVSFSTKKRKLTVSSFTLYSDDITVQLLVLLVCMENVFKELFLHAFVINTRFQRESGCKGNTNFRYQPNLFKTFFQKRLFFLKKQNF